ncbi:MAG: branched-chain amino acid ABC transporter permease, partial [Mycobacterium sp.]|nr:branched-chain amino acid ABC transporter permease [Mycobacterium sp.]
MLEYLIAGLVIGGIYAVITSGLVITYTSSGILNFSYGAIAYFVARCYYFFHTQQQWGIAASAVLSIIAIGPALGLFLYLTLFRLLRNASMLLQVVVTIGLSVAIPPISDVIFGNPVISMAPGLAPQPVHVYKVFGAAVTLDQAIILVCVAVILIAGVVVFRFTDAGLRVRAMVDSAAMTSLVGTNPTVVAMCVWVSSFFLAGLVGVLVAPISGLTSQEFTLLMATAFAAVIVAEMVNLGRAVVVAIAIGIIDSLLQGYLPPESSVTADIVASVPFAIMFIFLLVGYRRVSDRASRRSGGVLDKAIAPPLETFGATSGDAT